MGKKKNLKNQTTKAQAILPAAGGKKPLLANPWVHIAAIVLVSIAVYANTLSMDFVWDDFQQILENSQIRSLKNIPSIFSSEVWTGVKGGDQRSPYYRPLFTLSLAIDYAVWRDLPFGYHFTNVLLHVLTTVMLYLVTVRIFSSRNIALVAALVFAVHPVHADAIAWISARNEPLAAFFCLSSFYLFLLYRECGKAWYGVTSLFVFFLALLSKEIAVTFPLILFAYGVCFERERLRTTLLWAFIYGLVTVPYFILRAIVLERTTWTSFPLSQRVYTGIGLLADYFRLLVAPVNLKVFYDIPIKKSFFDSRVIIPFLVVTAVAVVIFLLRKDRRTLFSLLWIFIALAPVSGFVTIILPAPMAERYLYTASAGFAMACGVLALGRRQELIAARGSGLLQQAEVSGMKGLAILLILSTLFVLNFSRNFVYKDRPTFLSNFVKDGPGFYAGHSDLGVVYAEQGRTQDAMREFREALRLNPAFHKVYNNLGALYMQTGNYEDAAKTFETALKLNAKNVNAHYNLGIIYESQGRDGDAEREFTTAITLDPEMTDSHYNLGVVLVKLGKFDEAARAFEDTLRLDPGHANARYNLAAMYVKKGEIDKAVTGFQAAIRLSPDNQMFKKGLEKALEIQDNRSRKGQ